MTAAKKRVSQIRVEGQLFRGDDALVVLDAILRGPCRCPECDPDGQRLRDFRHRFRLDAQPEVKP